MIAGVSNYLLVMYPRAERGTADLGGGRLDDNDVDAQIAFRISSIEYQIELLKRNRSVSTWKTIV